MGKRRSARETFTLYEDYVVRQNDVPQIPGSPINFPSKLPESACGDHASPRRHHRNTDSAIPDAATERSRF
jgi:hypothetical protein